MPRITDDNRRWWILGAMGGVLALIVLDELVVGVALPTIRRDLGMSIIGSHWVVNAYLLVLAGFAAVAGRVGDFVDVKRLFLVGVGLFGVGSLACGFAQSGEWLITTRVIQGMGAAVIFPLTMAMIATIFPPDERGKAFGIQTAIGGVTITLAPLVGGFFTQVLSWRWIFWVNLPIVVGLALVMSMAWVSSARERRPPRFDALGAIGLLLGLVGLVLGIMQGPEWGWSRPLTIVLVAGGAVVLIFFAIIESRVRDPLIEIALLRQPTILGSNLVIFTGQLTKITLIVFGALFLQNVLRQSPFEAGLALLAAMAPTFFSSMVVGRLADRRGARGLAIVGLVLMASSMLWFGLAVVTESYLWLVPALLLYGLALPFHFIPPRRTVMNVASEDQKGQAGGISMTAQLLGGTIGMAVASTLFAVTGSYRVVFLAAGAVVLLVLIAAALLIERGLPDPPEAVSGRGAA